MRAPHRGRRKVLEKGWVQQYPLRVEGGAGSAAEVPAIVEGYEGEESSAAEVPAIVEGYEGEESSAAEASAITEGFGEREGSAVVGLESFTSKEGVSSSAGHFGYFGRESSTYGEG